MGWFVTNQVSATWFREYLLKKAVHRTVETEGTRIPPEERGKREVQGVRTRCRRKTMDIRDWTRV